MDDLTYSLRQLCKRNRDGSHATQADRRQVLTLASRQLSEQGFRRMKATSLQEKHVVALLRRWQGEGLSAGTLKNAWRICAGGPRRSAGRALCQPTTRSSGCRSGASSPRSAKPRRWATRCRASKTRMCR